MSFVVLESGATHSFLLLEAFKEVGMQTKELVRRVEEMVLPLCQEVGVVLWDVSFEKEGGQYMLTVMIDR